MGAYEEDADRLAEHDPEFCADPYCILCSEDELPRPYPSPKAKQAKLRVPGRSGASEGGSQRNRPPKALGRPRTPLFLITCGSKKSPYTKPARELYQGGLFLAIRDWVEASGYPYYILSAKHHLVPPLKMLKPYEESLVSANPRGRGEWTQEVLKQWDRLAPANDEVHIMAGKAYYQFLAPELERRGYIVKLPLAHLGIGKQISWCKKNMPQSKGLF